MSKPGEMLAIAAADTVDELCAQPELLDEKWIPIDVDLTRAARGVAFTGKITTRDEARALSIAACKLAGLSDRVTAKKIGCSRNTIAPVVALLERSGKLLSLQARLSDKLGRIAESCADEIQDIVTDGRWNLNTTSALKALSVATGIATEKYLLLNGQATAIVEQRLGAPPDLVAEWERRLKETFGPIIEISPSPAPSHESPCPVPEPSTGGAGNNIGIPSPGDGIGQRDGDPADNSAELP